MKRIFTHFVVLVLLVSFFGTGDVWAQFKDATVYRVVCTGTPSVSLGASALTDVAAVATNETDRSQQWYVTRDGDNYTFRNLANGRYLQGNNGTSAEWTLTPASNNFTVTTGSGNYCIRQVGHTSGYAYMHKDAGNNIVSWESSAGNSQWTPVEVSYTAEQLQSIWDSIDAIVLPESIVATYNTALEAIFADKACTQLNSTFTGMSVSQILNNSNYQALPATLQAMVLKVKSGDWSEANAIDGKQGWDNEYAKRFRVQMYEPYSIEGEITSYLRINAHSNMDNPTGIYADNGEPVYVMVDGDIAEGAELWIAHQAGLGATGYYNSVSYTQLHKGLNVVPYFKDGSLLWINYVVHTYNADGATLAEKFPHKISGYKPIKIHIEGGHINGYYNAIGDFRAKDSGTEDLWGTVDNDDDWNYCKVRAPLNGNDAPNRDFALLGHRQTLLFPLGKQANEGGALEEGLLYHLDNITVPSVPNCYGGNSNSYGNYSDAYYPGMGLDATNGKINIMLEAWDRITYSELASMGLVSKSTMDKMNSLYPRWTGSGAPAEIYNYGSVTVNGVSQTYNDFCQGLDYSEYFNHHATGVGAPSGYMSGGWRVCNYHYNTMGSIIGKIASEAGPTWGPAHEIGHQHQSVFNLNGQTEVTNNFFSNVAVWYMGMGTSRYNGNEGSLESVLAAFNKEGNDAYTNNIWALTHMYYRLWLYYHLAGNNTQFWPRLFELCRQEPLINGGQISGATSLLRFYSHACDAAGEDLTEFFRAHGYLEVMDNRLVGDYSDAVYNVTQLQIDAAIASVKAKNYPVNYAVLLINDGTEETTVKHDGVSRRALWDSNATAELGSVNDFIDGSASVGECQATVSADGNVTVTGNGGVGFLLIGEDGRVLSFSNKSSFTLGTEAMYQLATGKASVLAVDSRNVTAKAQVDLLALQKNLLVTLIAEVEAMPIDDGSYRQMGYYTKASTSDLMAALESAKSILEAGNGGYAVAYEILYGELESLLAADKSAVTVVFDPALTYTLKNYAYPERSMVVSNNVVYGNKNVDLSSNAAQWKFEATGTAGVYRVKNMSGVYCPRISTSAAMTVTNESGAGEYVLEDLGNGLWAINLTPTADKTSFHCASNDSYKVVGWGTGSDATRWYLTAVEAGDGVQDAAELQVLVENAGKLVDEVAIVSMRGKLDLQAGNADDAYYITSNATESGHEPRYLLDGDAGTFFHTVWNGTSPGEDHYLLIDMGESNKVDQFVLKYTTLPTTAWNVDAAKTILLQGAEYLDDFTTIATLKNTDANPLPTVKGAGYESAILGTKGTYYRYLRLVVTEATGGKFDNHYYFGMAELELERSNSCSKVNDAYEEFVNQGTVATVADKIVDARKAIVNGSGIVAAKEALQLAYDELLLEYNKATNAKKAELQALINETKELLNTVGSITTAKSEELALQVKNESGAYYLSTNSQENATNRDIANLLDGITNDAQVYFHTNWQTSVGTYHHLLLDMGNGNSLGEFTFKYTTRNYSAGIDAPRTIVVEGSNDNSVFTQIAELTDLPIGQHQTYESQVLGDNASKYRYVRFRVTSGAGTVGGYAYFAMSEFDVTAVGGTTVTIKDEYKATVTEDLFVATNSKVVDAETLMNNTTSIELLDAMTAELQAAYDALNALVEMLPQTNTFYALRCAYENRYLYVNETDAMQWNAQYDNSSSRAVWMFEEAEKPAGTFRMRSLHTGDYVGGISNNVQVLLGDTPVAVRLSQSESVPDAVVFADVNNGLGLHAHGSNNRVIGYTNAASANHYFLEEITPGDIHYDVTMAATYSSVMLNYNTVVPAGVTAYIATGIDGGVITLECVAEEGGILPANTPVILYRDDEETQKRFVYTDEVASVDVSASLLDGRLCTDYIECLEGYKYYKLLIKDGEAKMYHMYEEYDADGTFGPDNINKQTDNGGYIKCSANKIYMVLPVGDASMTTFDVRVDGATAVVEVESVATVKAVYDLQGRKVDNAAEQGVYIVDGKKVLVQ